MKAKQNIWDRITRKFNLKRFSFFLLAAFLFLILTKFSETYTEPIQFRVELYGLKDEVVIKQDSSNVLETIVRAKGFNLLPYIIRSTNAISIDANSYTTKNNNTLILDLKGNRHLVANQLNNAMDVLSVKPDTLYFSYDVMASKTVPVLLNTDISYMSGFDIVDELKLTQDSVKLVGSASELDSISYVVTKRLQLNDVKDDFTEQIEIEAPNSGINIIPEKLDITGVVRRFTEGKVSLPIELINVPIEKQLNYFPKVVDLIYYVDLDRFKDVDTRDFKVIADFKSLKGNNQKYIDLKVISSSPVVKSTRLNQSRVEFIILEK